MDVHSPPTQPVVIDQASDADGSKAAGRRWGLMLWPAAGLGAAGLLLARDPNVSGSYGFCPLLATTGLDCPFCGGLRGTHALLQGDVAAALDHNLLLPLFLVVGLFGLVGLLRPGRAQSARSPLRSRWLWWGVGAVTVVFFVVRNLPWFPYLDSGL
jgi:hypothetical protein